jgi:hypothetical protein
VRVLAPDIKGFIHLFSELFERIGEFDLMLPVHSFGVAFERPPAMSR